MLPIVVQPLQQLKGQASKLKSMLNWKKSEVESVVSSDKREQKGEVDADKAATQEFHSKETGFSKFGSIFGEVDLVSLGLNRSLFPRTKISLEKLFTGLQRDQQILVAIQDEMNAKYRTVPAPPSVRMWLSKAKELNLKIKEEIMEYKKVNRTNRYLVEIMVKTCLQLIVEGSMLNVYPDIAHTPHRVHPIPAHILVGQSKTFDRVVKLLRPGKKNNTGTSIGIYGMGAVGKTALMQRVNNYLALTFDFHIVIWVHVSRGDDLLLRVQRDILSRLGLPCHEDDGQNQQSICSSLLRLRFVLLLDELWEKLDLQKVGLPTSHNGKVVFTTRSKKVCKQMNAGELIPVDCLKRNVARKLLHKKIGSKELQLDHSKRDVADSLARCCHGLPLALVIAGSYMKYTSSLEDCKKMIEGLMNEDSPTGQSRQQTTLFSLLKLVYDGLLSDDSRLCLSASSSFPKYLAMSKEDLIRVWHGKKSLPVTTTDATDLEKGRAVVQTLVDASLLESKGDYDPYVKLHPVLHDMLSWIEKRIEGWTETAIKQAPNFMENDDVEEKQETMSTLPFKSSDSPEIQEVDSDPQQKEEEELGNRNNVPEPSYGMPTTRHNEVLSNFGSGKSLAETTTYDLTKATDSSEAGSGSSSSHSAGLFQPDPIAIFTTEPSSSTLESATTSKVSDIGEAGNVNRNVEGSVETGAPSAKSNVGPEIGPSSEHDDDHHPAKQLAGVAIAGKSSSPSNDNNKTETADADRGKSSLVAPETPPPKSGESSLDALPPTDTPISKQTEICNKVLSLLRDDNIKMVALWGQRGFGKSTLLKRIETEAQSLSSFEVVIRVALPASGKIEQKVVDDIAHALGVVTRSQDQQCRDIQYRLLHHRFLLLLDDLKESSELKKIGIQLPLKHSSGKIVFTSTTNNMSQNRDFQAVQVSRLDHTEAWELFKKELDNETLINSNVNASEHVKEITKEGQPLAIKLLAGVMKGNAREGQGMKLQMNDKESIERDNLEKIYRLSLNSLPRDDIRDCFIFTSLFPKDFWINEIDLFEYWIGEGFLSLAGCNSANEAIKQGQVVLELLKAANLLEEQAQNRLVHKAVKMHDALRDMDLGDRGTFAKWKTGLLVEAGMGLNEAPPYKKWETARRISIMANKIKGFRKAPRCNLLITLLLNQNYHLRELPKNFFDFAPSLQVLDLSHCGLRTLPPSIGKAVNLQYLNLSSTEINSLPKELEKLTKLKCLKLRETTALHSIPEGILSKFVNLQLLDMFHSGFALRKENFNNIIAEMEGLGGLKIIGICVENFGSLERLSKSEALACKLAYLLMSYCVDKVSIELPSTFGTMESLRELHISSCPSLEDITVHQEQGRSIEGIQKLTALEALYISHNNNLKNFQGAKLPQQCLENLRKLEVSYCPLVKSVSWVQCLPNLINLVIESNDMMTDLFGERMAGPQDCFPKLRFITLCNMSSLHTIGDSMNFPSLEYLVISRCPKVSKLPAGILNKNLKEIRGDINWWKSLTWAKETLKSSLLPLYKREVTLWD